MAMSVIGFSDFEPNQALNGSKGVGHHHARIAEIRSGNDPVRQPMADGADLSGADQRTWSASGQVCRKIIRVLDKGDRAFHVGYHFGGSWPD